MPLRPPRCQACPNSGGGSPLITPVVYDGTSAHPWQPAVCCRRRNHPQRESGGVRSTDNCSFGPFTWSVPKVKPVPFWNSAGLNGRHVILLEVQDTSESAPGPSVVAAVDQVVVWIDNQEIVASITSIGALAPCVDLHLKDFVGTTAEVRVLPGTRQLIPPLRNSRRMTISARIACRSKRTVVPAALSRPSRRPRGCRRSGRGHFAPGVDGSLAMWDIVNALDASSPTPTPGIPAAAKLVRNERCAYVIALSVQDTTHVGDSGSHHTDFALYAINIINDVRSGNGVGPTADRRSSLLGRAAAMAAAADRLLDRSFLGTMRSSVMPHRESAASSNRSGTTCSTASIGAPRNCSDRWSARATSFPSWLARSR